MSILKEVRGDSRGFALIDVITTLTIIVLTIGIFHTFYLHYKMMDREMGNIVMVQNMGLKYIEETRRGLLDGSVGEGFNRIELDNGYIIDIGVSNSSFEGYQQGVLYKTDVLVEYKGYLEEEFESYVYVQE